MKTCLVLVAFLQLAIVASRGEHKPVVSITMDKVKSRLKDLGKAVKGLLKTNDKEDDPASDGYIGCYKDDGRRHLKYKIKSLGNSITLAKCREHCKGYSYLGMQYQTFCLCGHKLANKRYTRVPETDCSMACAGEKKRKCGGGFRNSIYLVKP